MDACGEFTLSAPLTGKLSPEVFRICGTLSGRDVDKAKEAGLTLVAPRVIETPAIAEVPLTLECRILYAQRQVLAAIPAEIRQRYYTRGADLDDVHTAYVGQIVDAYLLKQPG